MCLPGVWYSDISNYLNEFGCTRRKKKLIEELFKLQPFIQLFTPTRMKKSTLSMTVCPISLTVRDNW